MYTKHNTVWKKMQLRRLGLKSSRISESHETKANLETKDLSPTQHDISACNVPTANDSANSSWTLSSVNMSIN